MKKFGIGMAITAGVLALAVVLSMMPGTASVAATGNGAPGGAHYNLNIIGVSKAKTGGDFSNDGHRMFVNLYGGGTKIWLQAGNTFSVIDADGTDGSARLQLLDPYPNNATTSTYRIYVRALGKPGGSATLTSGFVDEYGNYWYSLDNVTLTRTKGKAVFSDKTLQLTTINADIGYGLQSYNLFDNATYDYFWNYDNNGLKLMQLRMYAA